MKVENAVMPTPEQMRGTFMAPEDGPFVMVNLIKFRDRAAYASGEDVSGREAYMRYAKRMRVLCEANQARMIFSSQVVRLLLGEVEDLWDMVGLVEYPSRETFMRIAQSPEYREIEEHRIAGLAGQLNLETREL
jgi:uncharacterized protein (DUF1330 family)